MPGASRRAILKAGFAAATALATSRWTRFAAAQDDEPYDPGGRVRVEYDETISFNELLDYPPMLGRVEGWTLRVVADPADYFEAVRYIHYADVLPIYAAIHAETPVPFTHNDVWFDVGDGYVHSSYLVPVREDFQEPEEVIGKGFWGEITVPTSWQHWRPVLESRRYYDLAYGTVFWVLDRSDEPDGRSWYRIVDDANPGHEWWVQATHVRRIQEHEFAPISPDVPPDEKRIEISIGEQLLTCYEGHTPVFIARIASGTSFIDANGDIHHFNTPYGEHRVQRKTPSRHMIGGEDINDFFDLPGVPWCTFFTLEGAAIHGTYWHNDYGRPRSHGCINVTPDAAKWVYRWASPYAGYEEDYLWIEKEDRDAATRIIIT
jgi:hypothetical protein